jgi:hypothetical protein
VRSLPPPPPPPLLPAAWLGSLSSLSSCASLTAGKIAEDYPYLVENGLLDVILPKKQDLVLVKL